MPDHQPERPHDPEHDHAHSQLSEMELRVRALESVLTQKGYIEPAALDLLIETYEKKIGPHNGARVVAKAWVDEEFKRRLAAEPTPAIASLGYAGWQGEHMFVVENTPQLHNMVVARSRPPQSLELHVAAVFSVCGGPTRSRPRDRRR
jgi:nitrile hydratase subunit alpha